MRVVAIVVFVLGVAGLGLYFWWQSMTVQDWPLEPPALSGELTDESLQHSGIWRTYSVYIPAALKPNPAIVFGLHGSRGTGVDFREMSSYELDLMADKYGFILIYPDGFENHWNDCRKQGPYSANEQNIDDVGFLLKIVERMVRDYKADASKVFATGLSNGGQMAYRLALEAPDRIAGIAAIAANLPTVDNLDCKQSSVAVPVLIMNGTKDPINPYNGGMVSIFGTGKRGTVLSSEDTAQYFASLAQISTPSNIDLHYLDSNLDDKSLAYQKIWQANNRPQVVLITLNGAGHSIPHTRTEFPKILGGTNQDLNGMQLIWQFFETVMGSGEGGFIYDEDLLDQLPVEP